MKRIFPVNTISIKKVTNLFVVDLKHLHTNLIVENIKAALCHVKEVMQRPVVYSPIELSHIVWTTL
jgi:DNA mismatch repair ATPase MutL